MPSTSENRILLELGKAIFADPAAFYPFRPAEKTIVTLPRSPSPPAIFDCFCHGLLRKGHKIEASEPA
jgi:hypothetical protein